jgi:NAD(P)-dependent dehydrogenase (short-subunit alcohol dehydrogenase family)
MESNFRNKVIIITGAASGLGKGFAEALAGMGAVLILCDINEAGVRVVAEAINAEAYGLDVSDYESVRRLIAEAIARHGRLDYMFNNAGFAVAGEVQKIPAADWDRIIAVNLNGVVYGTTEAYKVMTQQGFGHIVNTASLAGLIPGPIMVPYHTVKFAVVGLSRSLRLEAQDMGVKVTALCPGFIESNIYESATTVDFGRGSMRSLVPFKLVKTDVAIDIMLRGIAANKELVIMPRYGKLLWWMVRFYYARVRKLGLKSIRSFRRRRPANI